MAGLPDLLCLREGRAVWLEVKQPKKKPSAIQVARMRQLEKSGGTPCHVVTSREEARLLLIEHAGPPAKKRKAEKS